MPPDLLSIAQVAERLSVTEAAVRKWISQRRLPIVKLGTATRLRTIDVNDLMRTGLPAPGSYPRPKDPRGAARAVVQIVPQSQLDRAS